jgi:flagellar hook assembly protein FlgD
MTFSDLPAGVNLKIYTTAGELVAERTSNTVGIAEWNGRTDSGQRAASGVYLVRVEGPGGDKIIKVAVER